VLALADAVEWQAAMSCVPSHTTVQEQKYVTTAGGIKFKPNLSGSIVFICPVTHSMPAGDYVLRGFIRSPIADRFGIDIALRTRNFSSGATKTIMSVVGVQSDSVGGGGQVAFRFTDSGLTPVDFDFAKNTYWVQISFNSQTASADTLSVLAAQLIRIE
jgi:hypothetical protein